MNEITEGDRTDGDADDGLGLGEGMCIEDLLKWTLGMVRVDEAIVVLRAAQTDSEIADAKRQLYLETSRARDFETSAAHYMRRYGFVDGVEVPGVGSFRTRRLDDWTAVLEKVECSTPQT